MARPGEGKARRGAATSETTDWIEVRLLGPLRVRRADGELVPDRDWRTGKNADLLRWLALEAGHPVAVEALLGGLWPGVDDTRARASLRTAASQLRRVLGSDVVERGSGGLLLRGAWVDAATFVELAREVGRRRREGRPGDALAAAREADALYLAAVPAGDGVPLAIAEHAAALAAVHRGLLGDAAEVAVELGWMRDAVELASRLRDADPVSERATRALMLGFAGMGELHHALREYERCRGVLAEELGVDPSPQTRAVHLQVLSPTQPVRAGTDLLGRRTELAWLAGALRDAAGGDGAAAAGHPRVVLVRGADGSGRRRLVSAACREVGTDLVEAGPDVVADLVAVDGGDRVVLWEPDAEADRPLIGRLLADPALVPPSRTLVLLVPPVGDAPAAWSLPGPHARSLELGRLLADDVEQIAVQVLGGKVTHDLVHRLLAESDGLPGLAATTARRWAGAGRLVATTAGLALAPDAQPADDPSLRAALARALPRLDGDAFDAVRIAAVLDQPVTPTLLAPLLVAAAGADLRARATAALEQLVDLSLLRTSPAGTVWRHPLLRDAVHAWLRPVERRRLHRRVAERALISSADRVGHWLAAGEQELACVAALEAAEECSARADHEGARTHLLQVCSLGDLPDAQPSDRVRVLERLGDACALLRRPSEAESAYQRALTLASDALAPETARLRRKVDASSDPRVLETVPDPSDLGWTSALVGLGFTTMTTPDAALERALLDAVAEADRTHDQRARVQTRLRMAGRVLLLRRQFRDVHEWVEAATGLGARPAERLHAAVVRHVPAVLLGSARTARQPLADASQAAEDAGEERLWLRLLGMRVIVAHDLGDPDFDRLWSALRERVLAGPVDDTVPELATVGLRVLAEREELDLAATMAQHLSFAPGRQTLVMEHVARIAEADLAEASGEHRLAAGLLRSVVEEGTTTRCLLLVPEAAARLVTVEAAHHEAAARAAFEVYDEVVGAALGGPREEFWRRMARAAVRAARDDAEGAALACTQAGALATQHGLQVLAARARGVRAAYLRSTAPPMNVVQRRPESSRETSG